MFRLKVRKSVFVSVSLFLLVDGIYSLSGFLNPGLTGNGLPEVFGQPIASLRHELSHASLAAIPGVLTRNMRLFLMILVAGVLIDIDHSWAFLGLPADARACHSLIFTGLVFTALSFRVRDAKRLDYSYGLSAASGILSHFAYDNPSALLRPLFIQEASLGFSDLQALVFWESAAVILALLASFSRQRMKAISLHDNVCSGER